MYIKNRSHIAV